MSEPEQRPAERMDAELRAHNEHLRAAADVEPRGPRPGRRLRRRAVDARRRSRRGTRKRVGHRRVRRGRSSAPGSSRRSKGSTTRPTCRATRSCAPFEPGRHDLRDQPVRRDVLLRTRRRLPATSPARCASMRGSCCSSGSAGSTTSRGDRDRRRAGRTPSRRRRPPIRSRSEPAPSPSASSPAPGSAGSASPRSTSPSTTGPTARPRSTSCAASSARARRWSA